MARVIGYTGVLVFEAASAGMSLGGASTSNEFAAAVALTLLGFSPMANRWADWWFRPQTTETMT